MTAGHLFLFGRVTAHRRDINYECGVQYSVGECQQRLSSLISHALTYIIIWHGSVFASCFRIRFRLFVYKWIGDGDGDKS